MRYQYAIFDMDGTLLDTMKYWRNAAFELAKEKGVENMDEELMEKLRHMTCTSGVEYIKSVMKTDQLDDVGAEDLLAIIERHYRNDATLKNGVREFLDLLIEQGIPMCVVSATPQRLVEIALQQTGIRNYFDFILTPDDFPKGKKDPAIFLEVLRRFDSNPKSTALFEDAYYSIKTAKSLGFYIVGVEDAFEKRHQEKIMALSDEYFSEDRGFILASKKEQYMTKKV